MSHWAPLVAQGVKNPAHNVGDLGSIPGLERSPGEGKGYPLQYSGLENPMDHTVHGLAELDMPGPLHFHVSRVFLCITDLVSACDHFCGLESSNILCLGV